MVTGAFWHRTHRPIAQPQLEKLRYSKFSEPKYMEEFPKRFDSGPKKASPISNSRGDQFVEIGAAEKNDPSCGIRGGLLKLTG